MNADWEVGNTVNREYKDTVFTLLFNNEKTIIEIYGVITGKQYALDTKVEITTLKNVLYRGRINDLAFMLDGKPIVLIEDQSTINENMPLRMLFYIAEVYNRHAKEKDIYRKTKLPLPRPEFIELYNGVEDMPEDEQTLKLSDRFIYDGANSEPYLELTVKVYNINKGRNPEIARRSPTLDGYETFIQIVRDNEEVMSLEEAVTDCINQNILNFFLSTTKRRLLICYLRI